MKRRVFVGTAMAVALSAACVFGAASSALATDGLQSGTQQYNSNNDAWNTTDPNAIAGQVRIIYDTTGGKYQVDTGSNTGNVSVDTATYSNGSYLVTTPTVIKFSNMNIGTVNTDVNYDINVKGVIKTDQTVSITTTQSPLTLSTDSVNVAVNQSKSSWDYNDTFGELDNNGSISGTDSSDVMTANGVIKACGTYTGKVTYVAKIG